MRTTRDFPISHFLTIRARAECVLRIRIMCTHATQHGQSNARRTVSRYLSLRKTSGRRSGAKRCGVVVPGVGRRARATHQLFGARPIKRSLYDSAMRARRSRRRTTATNAEYCVSTRENRAAVHCGRPMLSVPIAFSGSCRRNS